MDVILDKAPRPVLLSSAVTPSAKPAVVPVSAARIFYRNVLRLLGGTVVGAAILAGIIVLGGRYLDRMGEGGANRMLGVTTRAVAATPSIEQTPYPVVVEFGPEMVQVTAIVLGHPHLAVINGRTLTEGESVVVHSPTHAVAVTLKVMRIVDGHVDLFDGSHIVRAHFSPPSAAASKP